MMKWRQSKRRELERQQIGSVLAALGFKPLFEGRTKTSHK